MRAALFDYGAGNLHSLGKALETGGAEVRITRDWDEALAGDVLVLPGVGSFGAAVEALGGRGAEVRSALEAGLPCLGICLGMQLFFDESEEGEGRGIGILPGRVRKMEARRVPQMGWNDVELRAMGDDGSRPDPVFEGVDRPVAYYANSYVCEPADEGVVTAWSEYEGDRFVAGVRAGSVWGFQFHPEKSSDDGLRIIHNFLDLVRDPENGRGARGSSDGNRGDRGTTGRADEGRRAPGSAEGDR